MPVSDLSPSITRVEMQKVAARQGPLQRTLLPCQGSCLISRCLAWYLWIRTQLAPRKHWKRPGIHLGILPQLNNILHENEYAPIRVAPHRYPRSSRSGCKNRPFGTFTRVGVGIGYGHESDTGSKGAECHDLCREVAAGAQHREARDPESGEKGWLPRPVIRPY